MHGDGTAWRRRRRAHAGTRAFDAERLCVRQRAASLRAAAPTKWHPKPMALDRRLGISTTPARPWKRKVSAGVLGLSAFLSPENNHVIVRFLGVYHCMRVRDNVI